MPEGAGALSLHVAEGAKARLESFDAKDKVFVCIAGEAGRQP